MFGRIPGNHAGKRRPCPVNQQVSSIAVSPFGDAQELHFAASGVLARHKAEKGGKLPAVFEVLGHTGDGQQDRSGHDADAGNPHQALTGIDIKPPTLAKYLNEFRRGKDKKRDTPPPLYLQPESTGTRSTLTTVHTPAFSLKPDSEDL